MNIFHKITLANLGKNRTRTLVTIIGIILSTSMFTAVTTCVSSLQHFMLEYTAYNYGSWHGAAQHMDQENMTDFLAHDEVDTYVTLRSLGFTVLEDSSNFYKPYLHICGVDDSLTTLLPVHLLEGRMPQNDTELLLPEHLASNGLVKYNLGDILTLDVGRRTDDDGYEYDNHTPLLTDDSNPSYLDEDSDGTIRVTESIIDTKARTYTVVGFYERPSYEDYSSPGYTALTYAPDADANYQDIYFTSSSGTDIQSFLEENAPSVYSINYSYLRMKGASGESTYNRVLYSLASILIGIIVFGSISLIYNAFSISISERTRQFGLLSSIGATKRQMIHSVLFEAAFLCIIGIPLGIASGLLGIGITLHFTGNTIANIFSSASVISLRLHPSVAAIVVAALLAFFTVLLSAFLPARRSMKLSAIEAIRQTTD
ncbi:MAG: FtsX-like permease family protein, partial [Lachnospiraceae bacterium]|nr:FtsX-like permease family protein [Lachnospiraceae bacterium]